MSFRTVMNRFDWDGEKYRMSDKAADKGNRRRVIKNFVRFVKNPFGYTYWKGLRNINKFNMVWLLWGAWIVGII